MWAPAPLAVDLPLAAVVGYWLLASVPLASLELLWLLAHRQPASAGSRCPLLLAQLGDMLSYGKVKETWSPTQNVPKAWFGHFYAVRCLRTAPAAQHSSSTGLLPRCAERLIMSASS
eukprot:COSAG06_NODE_6359_length_2967_cov_40.745816_3_plen_117_part_00